MTATSPAGGVGHTCPSSPAATGSVLLGLVGPSGVAYVTPAVHVTADLLDELGRDGPAEKRFRFAGDCHASACGHWTGHECGLIDQIVDAVPSPESVGSAPLPRCSIRAQCQWFHQRGVTACAACPLVVSDRSGTDPD